MSESVIVLSGLFGLLIGSFLNVVIWRVPRGESLAVPPSHCPSCGHNIRPYDNVPVLSWLVLRGRCRDCKARISVRYPLVEAFTGGAFALTAAIVGPQLLLLPMLWFLGTCIALAMIDIDVMRLPNAIVVTAIVVVAAGLLVVAVAEGEYHALVMGLVCAFAMGIVYLLLALAYPGGMGMGDVKLGVLLGLVLGWFSASLAVLGFFAAFALGSAWGVFLVVSGRGGRKTAVPFGPFMIAGAWLALVWGAPVVAWYADLLPTG